MTKEELEAIKKRCDKATPGPWRVVCEWDGYDGFNRSPKIGRGDNHSAILSCLGSQIIAREDDFAFIVHARDDVPVLVAEVERLQSEVKRLEELVESEWG